MKTTYYDKFYRVYKNDTRVTLISNNDFLPCKRREFETTPVTGAGINAPFSIQTPTYSFPEEKLMYYGYLDRIKALEMAKKGALKHIGVLISDAQESIARLKQYRNDHYTDLNSTLLDSNIRRLEKELRG